MKILIVTALSLEFQAVEKHLTNLRKEEHPTTGSKYERGQYVAQSGTFDIMLVETGAGNNRATDETGRAIQYFQPDYCFFVGVAGGVKDVTLGDVVASSKIIGFEVGKAEDQFKPRLDVMPASYRLEQIAKEVKRSQETHSSEDAKETERLFSIFVQPIAVGEKVVASTKSETYRNIKTYCSDAVAVDMEGIGFLIAARPYNAQAIEVRGISDMLDDKELADAAGSQPTAAANAAAVTFQIINQLKVNRDIKDEAFQKKLLNYLVKHYPMGPEQDDVWERAGGDVSIFVNTANRKMQWRTAIKKLSLGGGGANLTLQSFLNVIKEDFPHDIQDLE